MNINIPVPDQFQDDFRKLLTGIAQEVLHEVKDKEIQSKPYMTIKETQAYLGISFGTLQVYQNMGLKSIAVTEGKKLFKKSTIDQFMAQHEK